MTSSTLIAEARRLSTALDKASLMFSQAVRAAYPAGTCVVALLGGHEVTLRVISHPGIGNFYGVNVKTGKRRRFTHSAIVRLADEV